MPRPTVQAVGLSLVVSGSWPELLAGQESAVQSWALVFRRQSPVLGSLPSLVIKLDLEAQGGRGARTAFSILHISSACGARDGEADTALA